ncbi:MAG TPA: hypothetical protein VF809_02885 [Candidatus Saccharimonadales bacterium]
MAEKVEEIKKEILEEILKSVKQEKCCKPNYQRAGGGQAVYGLGGIGALVYFIQQADGFWNIIIAILKAIVWPAFMVHDLLKFIS